MLKLNVNQEKQLTFEVQIGGVQSDQVKSHLRIEIDDVEYGFPAQVGNESISVNLPPLRTVTARKLKEGEEVQVKLEIIADDNYLTPWQDTFRLSNPLVVEAKIVDDEFTTAPAFKTKLVSTKGNAGEQSQGVMIEQVESEAPVETPKTILEQDEDALTEKIVNKLAEKLNLREDDDEMPAPDGEEGDDDDDDDDDDDVKKEFIKRPSVGRAKGGFGRIAGKKTQGGFGSIQGKEAPAKKLPAFTREDLMNMEEADVYAYMERAGTKNPTIQKIVYEQAEAAAQSSVPFKVLHQVIKIMKAKR
jgi:hypothetical protein